MPQEETDSLSGRSTCREARKRLASCRDTLGLDLDAVRPDEECPMGANVMLRQGVARAEKKKAAREHPRKTPARRGRG